MHNYSLFSELILTTFVGSQTHNSDAEGPLNASLQLLPLILRELEEPLPGGDCFHTLGARGSRRRKGCLWKI